jgi:hypothetical protein
VVHDGATSTPVAATHAQQGSKKCLIQRSSLKIVRRVDDACTFEPNMPSKMLPASTAEECSSPILQNRNVAPPIGEMRC